jgi:hypothetical protein
MRLRQVELLSSLVMLAAISCGFYLTTRIDLTLSSELETFTGPRAYPRIILSGMLVLVLALVAKALGNYKSDKLDSTDALNASFHPRLTKVFAALFLLVVFTSLFESLGYLITLFPLLLAFGYLNGANNLARNALFSVIAAAICLIIFRYGLNTVLPEGILGIDEIF